MTMDMLDGRFVHARPPDFGFFPTNSAFSRRGHSQFQVCIVLAIDG